MKRTFSVFFALALSCPLVVLADDLGTQKKDETMRARMGEVKIQRDFQKSVDDTTAVYAAITKGSHGEVPVSILRKAKCIAVLPGVITGALIVGGTHGGGLASCRTEANTWSQPTPISLNQGSVGLQVGGKSTDLVLFFQTKVAVDALKRGNLALGSDVSAVAGTFDSSVDTSTAGIIAYNRTEGLFAGAALTSGKIGQDQDELVKYYGENINYTKLLEGRALPDSTKYSEKLTKLFPS